MGDLSEHFDKSEFSCKCGCGLYNLDAGVLGKLILARNMADVSFHINSACRCAAHNADVGGVAGSSHMEGLAVDIAAADGHVYWAILNALMRVGFHRFGFGRTYIHVDNDLSKLGGMIWFYGD